MSDVQNGFLNRLDHWIRGRWRTGSLVQVVCTVTEHSLWRKGKIMEVTSDGHCLHIQLTVDALARTLKVRRGDAEAVRPWPDAMPIYKFMFCTLHDALHRDALFDSNEPPTKEKSNATDIDLVLFGNSEQCDGKWNGDGSIMAYCSAVSRMVACLDWFASLERLDRAIDDEETQSRLMSFVSETYPQLLDDFVHFTTMHDQHLADVHHEAMKRKRLGGCLLKDCVMAGRHCDVEDDDDAVAISRKILPTEAVFWMDYLDSVHFYVLHAFDFGLRMKIEDVDCKAKNNDEQVASEDVTDACFVDVAFQRLQDKIHAKRAKLHRFFGRAETAQNKFKFSTSESITEAARRITFFCFLRRRLAHEKEDIHLLFDYLLAQHFDTEALSVDMSDPSQSNVAKLVGPKMMTFIHGTQTE